MTAAPASSAAERLSVGRSLHLAGRFDEARLELEAACALAPSDPSAHSALGRLLLDCDELAHAKVALERALELGSQDPLVAHGLAEVSFNDGDHRRAWELFTRTARLYESQENRRPACSNAINAAVARFRAGDVSAAEAELEDVRRRFPESTDAVLALARVTEARPPDGVRDAIRILEGLLDREPEHLLARNELAMVLARHKGSGPAGRQAAVRELERLQATRGFPELLPDAFMAHYALGCCYDDEPGSFEAAATQYQQALGLRPSFAPALCNLGVIFERAGRPRDALELFAHALGSDPGCVAAARNLARLFLELGEDEVLSGLRESLALGDAQAEAALAIVRAVEDKSQSDSHAALCEAIHRMKNRAGVLAGRLSSLSAADEHDDECPGAEVLDLASALYDDLSDLLGFLRPPEQNPEVVCANTVVRRLAAVFSGAAPENVSVRAETTDGALPVRIDKERVRDLLTHLARNAIAAMPNGGELAFRASPSSVGEGWAELSVSDTGEGIPADRLADVMRGGVSLRPGGSGLGLWICTRIARAHGGTLTLESTQGVGTRAKLTLPPPEQQVQPARALRLRRSLVEELGPQALEVSQDEPPLPGLSDEEGRPRG
jgi:signal transduction histidine kinase